MKCLQEKTGSCRGCNIIDIVENAVKRGEPPEVASKRISIQLCPTNAKLQQGIVRERQNTASCGSA